MVAAEATSGVVLVAGKVDTYTLVEVDQGMWVAVSIGPSLQLRTLKPVLGPLHRLPVIPITSRGLVWVELV